MVVVASTVLVGSAVPLLLSVVLTSTVMGWSVPEQDAQKSAMSILASLPVTPGTKVWPSHCVVLRPVPLVEATACTWSGFAGLSRTTLPGLVFTSVLFVTPAAKSACVVSVAHEGPKTGVGSIASEKVVVPAPGAVAFIEKRPDDPLAVSGGAVARPEAFVTETADLPPVLGKFAPAPLPPLLAVHVTVIPAMAGLTVTLIGVVNCWLSAVFWLSPLVFAMADGMADATQPMSRNSE